MTFGKAERNIGILMSLRTNLILQLKIDVVKLVVRALVQATEMGREPNSWEIFKKLHQKKDDSFVDAKSKSINDKMEVVIPTALSGSTDDSSEDQELDTNCMYFDIMGGAKK